MKKFLQPQYLLWLSLAATMAASLEHLAWAFGTVEFPGRQWFGWIPAIALESGQLALVHLLNRSSRQRAIWLSVATFCVISTASNVMHAVAAQTGGNVVLSTFFETDVLYLIKSILLSGSLTIMNFCLVHAISVYDGDRHVQPRPKSKSGRNQLIRRLSAQSPDLSNREISAQLLARGYGELSASQVGRILNGNRRKNDETGG
jgi:hypothetical protein